MNKYDNIRIFEDTMRLLKTVDAYRDLTDKAKVSTKLYEKVADTAILQKYNENCQNQRHRRTYH